MMFDIPTGWLESLNYDLLQAKRRDVLKDMLVWAIGADLIEGFSEIDDTLFNHAVIPVKLTERGQEVALRAGGDDVAAWAAGLSEHGIQVKLFAKSETPGEFHVMDFYFERSDHDYTKYRTEAREWCYGSISEWRNSLPDVIFDAIKNLK